VPFFFKTQMLTLNLRKTLDAWADEAQHYM
jgi:hypothetical protein